MTGRVAVPPFYLIQATNGSSAAGGDVLFAAKEARCFLETAFVFVYLSSAKLSARQEVLASPWRSQWRLHRHMKSLKRNPARCSGREPLVPMMEPADLRKRHDLSGAAGLNRSPLGSVLAKRKMGSGSVVIIEVRNKDPSQMPFIQDDHVVQARASFQRGHRRETKTQNTRSSG